MSAAHSLTLLLLLHHSRHAPLLSCSAVHSQSCSSLLSAVAKPATPQSAIPLPHPHLI